MTTIAPTVITNSPAQDIAATLSAQRTELQAHRAALSGVMLGQGYIVEVQGVYLAFTVADGTVTDPRTACPTRATRFTRADAERVAANVRNGNDKPGRVLHLFSALDEEVASLDRMLAPFGI